MKTSTTTAAYSIIHCKITSGMTTMKNTTKTCMRVKKLCPMGCEKHQLES